MRFQLAAFADEASDALSEQITAMLDNGIAYLEIRGVDGQSIADISTDKAKDIRRQLEANGLSVWSLGSPYGKIGITDAFAPHLDQFKRGLELAHILGARHIRLFSFYLPSAPADAYRDEVFARLEQFVLAAKGSGIVLCHENEKGIYGETAARCLEIHQAVPSLKAVFDPANFIQSGQDTLQAWDMLSAYVEYVHIKDALKNGSVVPAGDGIGNIPWILEQYKGDVLTVEPHLTVFSGLDKLEAGRKTQVAFCYPSSQIAFNAAVNALKALI